MMVELAVLVLGFGMLLFLVGYVGNLLFGEDGDE